MFYASFAIAVASSVLYHVFQKAISPSVNPALSLLVTYAVAFALSLPLLAAFPLRGSMGESFQALNWASFALALSIVGLEIGFLLAYRAGWDVSLTGVAANVAAALVLIPAGILLFKEKPSWVNLLGVFVCISGLILINWRR